MNLQELKTALDAEGISELAYSFSSDGFGEVFRISAIHDILGDGWEVYYSERGNKNELVVFRTEEEACEYFLRRLLKDPSTRKPAFLETSSRCTK